MDYPWGISAAKSLPPLLSASALRQQQSPPPVPVSSPTAQDSQQTSSQAPRPGQLTRSNSPAAASARTRPRILGHIRTSSNGGSSRAGSQASPLHPSDATPTST